MTLKKILIKTALLHLDEFIDIWVYVTLQARVSDLCWDILYLKEYSNPNYMLSETGYYLSSLEMAAEYIKSLNSDSLDSGEVDEKAEVFVLLPDMKMTRRLCEIPDRIMSLEDEDFTVKGFEMVTTLDMIRDTSR